MKKSTFLRLNRMSAEEMEKLIGKIAEAEPDIEKNDGWWTLDTGDGEPLEGFDLPALLDDSYMTDEIADSINDDAALWEKVKNA